ncbi:MAG: acetyl-CoA carboxylase biotin carboxyl carrier protein [Phycisphaerales bacterium]|nr:acetyl-CoA carboxylase biotin carboxyl carrier protein [Phycisphaerales bacterium]
MVDNDLLSISLRNGTEQITLRRPERTGPPHVSYEPMPAIHSMPVHPASALPLPPAPAGSKPVETEADAHLVAITSPMVGTFYGSSHPGSPPFVHSGTAVTPDKVVCIIEAMKVFNEIPADVSGTIEKVLAVNEQPVEFGQRLFLVRPH